ncbi:MAG TPA: hypothetical protein VFZ04_20365 [Longimicrobiales bacterium]
MTNAVAWLEPHLVGAPEQLRRRMLAAIEPAESVPHALAEAALGCLRDALENPDEALDLLAADALLTHALHAAAEQGDDALQRLVESLDAASFQRLIEER